MDLLDAGAAPSQIDCILVSSRWATGARDCKTTWGLPITVHGRKYDHALLTMKFKIRLQCDQRRPRKDFSDLRDDKVRENHKKPCKRSLKRLRHRSLLMKNYGARMKQCKSSQSSLPKKLMNPDRKWKTSRATFTRVEKKKQL